MVNATYFSHKNDLIHRDIKPENILMFENGVVKFCDFGWCTRLDGGQRITFCGTVEYMSPEMVNKEEYIIFFVIFPLPLFFHLSP